MLAGLPLTLPLASMMRGIFLVYKPDLGFLRLALPGGGEPTDAVLSQRESKDSASTRWSSCEGWSDWRELPLSGSGPAPKFATWF